MNHYIKKVLLLLFISIIVVSCNRVKTSPEVKETYTDGKPKRIDEYITDDKGNKILYKETHYFPGEKKHITGTYDNTQQRNGVWTSWYETGQKNSEQNYVNGKDDGPYHVWYPNGKPYIKGEYKMGKKTGVWSFYDTLGNLLKETDFGKK